MKRIHLYALPVASALPDPSGHPEGYPVVVDGQLHVLIGGEFVALMSAAEPDWDYLLQAESLSLADGDPVTEWGEYPARAGGTYLEAGLAGHPAVEADGAVLDTSDVAFDVVDVYSADLVFVASGRYRIGYGSESNDVALAVEAQGGTFYAPDASANNWGDQTGITEPSDDLVHVHRLHRSEGLVTWHLDGVEMFSGAGLDPILGQEHYLSISNVWTERQPYGRFGEAYLAYNRPDAPTRAEAKEADLIAKYLS